MDNSSLRIPLLLIGIFVLAVVIIGYLFLTAPEPEAVLPVPEENLPGIVQEQQEITPVVTALSKTGTQVKTRDFLADKDTILFDEESKVYLIGEEYGPNGPLYQSFYFDGGGVTVTLLDENLSFARLRAEASLQKKLGLSLIEMCSLQIRVGTPIFISDEFSGQDLGLSFCPGSVAL